MKKRLLKPPQSNGEIILLPSRERFISQLGDDSILGVCHQPYFFNPGVALKFLFLEYLPKGKKEIIFLDTDRINLEVRLPTKGGIRLINFLNGDEVLFKFLKPSEEIFSNFFSSLEDEIRKEFPRHHHSILKNIYTFKEILFSHLNKELLKEILTESFLEFYGIERKYSFLSEVLKCREFNDFFLKIYLNSQLFRDIFNQSLDEYKKEFKFRYRNFPFPGLEEDELPFWLIKDNKRVRLFKNMLDFKDFKRFTIFPRASTLTIFLRLYRVDFFIHGIGGANYEWVCDRIIERFFQKDPPFYAVISGTFLIGDLRERHFPYFFFSPQKIIREVKEIFAHNRFNRYSLKEN